MIDPLAAGTPTTGTMPLAPLIAVIMRMWSCPCRISSAPQRSTARRKRLPSVSFRHWLRGIDEFWRVMDQDHAEETFVARLGEERFQPVGLMAADVARRHEGRRRDGRRYSDQRDMALAAHEGEQRLVDKLRLVAEHPRRPERAVTMMRARHIGVVVAGDGGHQVGRAELLQPAPGILEFLAHGDVGEVAGDGDVVGRLRLQVRDQPVERVGGDRSGRGSAAN